MGGYRHAEMGREPASPQTDRTLLYPFRRARNCRSKNATRKADISLNIYRTVESSKTRHGKWPRRDKGNSLSGETLPQTQKG